MLPLADVVIEMLPRFVEGADRPEKRTLKPREVLFEEGSLGGKIYIVDQGNVEIVRHDEGGTESVVWVNKPGDHFGEMGPLFDLPRSATARGGPKGATVTGYTLRQFSEIIGLETLGGLVGKAGLKKTPGKKLAAPKRATTKKAAAAKKAPAKKTIAKKAPAKKASARR
jgi:putative ABC transport system ATP-binding protein